MIEHQVQEPARPTWQVLLIVVVLVLAVNAVVTWINQLKGGYGGIVGLLLIIGLALYSSRLMNRKLARYTYQWDGAHLRIKRKIGRREKELIEIPGQKIEWVQPAQTMEQQRHQLKRARKTLVFACRMKGEDVYVLQFQENGRIYRVWMQLNQPLLEALQQQTGNESG